MSSAAAVEALQLQQQQQQQQQQQSPNDAFFSTVHWALFIGVCGIAGLVALQLLLRRASASPSRRSTKAPPGFTPIPEAVGGAPLLGHALKYKQCPASFVMRQCATVGPIFSINLAGKRMIVVGNSEELLRQVACQPERVLSAREAVAQVGFDQMLGHFSVHRGTDLHKRILKTMLRSDTGGIDAQVPQLFHAVRDGIRQELSLRAQPDMSVPLVRRRVPDFFTLVRRCMLRAMLHCLVGPAFAAAGGAQFVSEFIKFQDAVENATAQAAVLPRVVALPLVLWPCAVRRRALTKRVRSLMGIAFECASGQNEPSHKLGPWLEAIRDPSIGLSTDDGAQLIISLLFAAHKNPAIGAAQTLMCLHGQFPDRGGSNRSLTPAVEKEGCISSEFDEAVAEASHFRDCVDSERNQTAAEALRACNVIRRACLETLRLTAHTLGALRVVQQDVDLQDGPRRYRLFKGQTVALSHIASSWDEKLWGVDCRQFRPARREWLNGVGKSGCVPVEKPERDGLQRELGFVTGPHAGGLSPYKMTAFSHGVHVCPGQRFAMVAMQIVVAQLLEFDIRFERPVPPISFERATLAQRSATVTALFRPRDAQARD